jgi:uncharacterized membrane protein
MVAIPRSQRKISRLHLAVGLVFLGGLLLWLTMTPVGFAGKLQAVAYAVCEQDPTHTLELGGRLLPLCSRCTGMYLGSLVALACLIGQGKARLAPSKGKSAVLGLFFLAFVADGLNSLVAALWPKVVLYAPNNTLRLITGLGMGMVIANVLLPLWNQTFWAEGSEEPVLHSWRRLLAMILLETVTAFLVLNGWSGLYFPVAILATGMVPVLITMIYTLLLLVILKKENVVHSWQDGWSYVAMGAILALAQIGLFDLLRFSLTGTWQGLHF